MKVVNQTPFVLERSILLDKKGAEYLLVALKASYAIAENGDLALAERQAPIQFGDKFYGDPEATSIQCEDEMGPVKLSTDVFLRGCAVAKRKGTHTMPVQFRVGSMRKTAIVFGERFWRQSLGKAKISDPAPFESIPLIYENAYGGRDMSAKDAKNYDQEHRNPIGRGFRTKHATTPWVDTPLPNIENPNNLIHDPESQADPLGFGPIGRHWQPRVNYAGTYDQKWIAQRMPLLPDDFDDRFHNAAPPDFIASGYIKGGEVVEVAGCTKSGKIGFKLPKIKPRIAVRVCTRNESLSLACNSVTVDTEQMMLHLLWKGTLYVHREALRIKEIACRIEGEQQ